MAYQDTETCPYCKQPVAYEWTERGICSRPEYVLVADWIYHSHCWDKQYAENPPVYTGDGDEW